MAQTRPWNIPKAPADTERLQLNVILKEIDALALGGTVTSVAVTGSTGLTVGGSPVTTAGTITLTLSANLQSWSSIAPASKYDASNPAGYTTNLGTVTSVGITGSTGLTVGSSPVTTSGTITLTLSANLQAWSALTTASKYDASNPAGYTTNVGTVTSVGITGSTGLTVGSSPITTSGTITLTLSANLQAWSAVTTASKADDSLVVHLAGAENITGLKTFTNAFTVSGGTPLYGSLEMGFRDIPRVTGGLDRGKCNAVTAGFTINTGAAAGSTYSVYNDSASAITLTQGAGLTLRLSGGATTGNRTLAARGFCTLWFNSTTECITLGDVT